MNRLKELRKNRGVTQTEIAGFIGISQNSYSYWENGKVKIDNASIVKLADYFNVSVDFLLGREEQKNIIERPPYDVTDKQLIDLVKLYGVLTEIQKAQVLGYVIGLLEQSGVNVKGVLGR